MHYNDPIIRPQTDAYSLFVEVTVGCTHNSCTFCNFYDGYPFRAAPLEQIEEDLKEAKQKYGHVDRIWASGGNPYALSTERLARVGELFQTYYMYLNMVTVVPGTKLYEERQQGTFVEAEERERLTEFITLLSGMKNDIRIFAAPNTTNFSFDIDLQKDKERVVSQMIEIRDQLTDEDEARLRAYRNAKTSV